MKRHQPPARESSTKQAPVREMSTRIPDAGHDQHDDEIAIKAFLSPKELYSAIVEAGVIKSKWRWDKQVVMGLIAAFYLGFACTTMSVVGGQIATIQHDHPGIFNLVLGSFGFPMGLFMICVVGADLFTSDCTYMMTAFFEGRIRWYDIARSWIVSWWVNLAGSIIFSLIVFWAQIFDGRSTFVLALAHKKVSATFGACLCKGILANWLVNLAVWIANSAQDITGKAVGIFLPISAFVAMGAEHCIANQSLFSLAKFLGSDVPVSDMATKNLIPTTIGNIIGGAFFVSTMYGFAIGSLFDTSYAHAGRTVRRAHSCLGLGRCLPLQEPPAKQQPATKGKRRVSEGSASQDGKKLTTALHRAFVPRTVGVPARSPAAPAVVSAAAAQDESLLASPDKSSPLPNTAGLSKLVPGTGVSGAMVTPGVPLVPGASSTGAEQSQHLSSEGGDEQQVIPAGRGLSTPLGIAYESAAEIYRDA